MNNNNQDNIQSHQNRLLKSNSQNYQITTMANGLDIYENY